MRRRAFLLGLYSIGGQVLLLRELVGSLNGDEIFIGTALFGWLIAVGCGAYVGGRMSWSARPEILLISGCGVLPLVLIGTRLAPLIVTDVPGEVIPFSVAATLSIVMMIPAAFISGYLFPTITRAGRYAGRSIVRVYLFEGLGAFVGGVLITLLAGGVVSSLELAVLLAAVVWIGSFFPRKGRPMPMAAATLPALFLLVLVIGGVISRLDRFVEDRKYEFFRVERSFDTHYTHQTILSRGGLFVLLTDNTVEATYPDWETAENLLIPPLVYRPRAERVLVVGRAEFGVAQIARQIPSLSLMAVDPRRPLSSHLDQVIADLPPIVRVADDPAALFTRRPTAAAFDVLIISAGAFDNYRNSRFVTGRLLRAAKRVLKREGVLCLPTPYDTDRYISGELRDVLAVIYNVLSSSFSHVTLWPGATTVFLASDEPLVDLSVDSVLGRIADIGFQPDFVNENYLYDRLAGFRLERLNAAVGHTDRVNSLNRPVLAHLQAVYRARASEPDRKIAALLDGQRRWTLVPAALILAFWTVCAFVPRSRRRFGLFLYFVAGLVSLSLELLSFYVYQSLAGSLYSEMAVLIGAFMLGLAFGTYYSERVNATHLEYPALLTLLAAAVLYLVTYEKVAPQAQLVYHLLFLFVVAAATGSLFVAATARYYPSGRCGNQGTGYAWELIGSSLGALSVTTILLPTIGLRWLLVTFCVLLAMAVLGAMITSSRG